ncbi:MAG: FAD-dependent oxidoreductase [Candidatus Binatia bacterium]
MEVISRTGCAIITNQGAYPDRKGEGKAYCRQLALYDDKYIPSLARVAEMINRHGAISIQQILHGGRYGGIELDYCIQPSSVKQTLRHFRPPKEMTKAEIKQCIYEHAQAARRSIEAGFDGVEITSFMGYLLSDFNSKFINVRTDEYGGSVENRGRFMVELIQAIKEAIGDEKPVIIRLNGVELMDEYGGNTPEECLEFMKMAEQAGADCISLVIGWHESRTGALGRDVPTDHWLHLAEAAKKVVNIPVAFGPRFGDPFLAERAMGQGSIDFWEVCRPLLADPELVHKMKEDRTQEIKPCVGGLLCLSRMFRNLPYICAVNPQLGHEYEPEYQIKPTVARKKVMVVGAGPGGLECAITAAKRGHQVTICDTKAEVGGQLLSAAKEVGGGEVFLKLVDYYKSQIEKFHVTLRLGTEVTPKLCEAEGPDVVVVATGAGIAPGPKGGNGKPKVLSAFDVLEKRAETGKKIVVLGGDRLGLVAAEVLAAEGREVAVVEEEGRVGVDVIPTWKWRHDKWVKEFSIRVFVASRVEEVCERGVRIKKKEGEEGFIEADTIVQAGPRKAQQDLLGLLEFSVDEIYIIGDAIRPRSMHNAIHEGFKIGVRI